MVQNTESEMRFGQPEQVIQTLVESVRRQRAVAEEDFEALIDMANTVGNLVATMHLMGSTGHMTNPTLRQEVVAKLPSSLKRQWGEHLQTCKSEVDLEDLSMWLGERADAVRHVRKVTSTADEHRKPQAPKRPNTFHSSMFATTDSQCGVCKKEGHLAKDCRSLAKKSVNDRWKWLKADSRCFTCLGQGYRARECPKKTPCGKDGCERVHHPLLHPTKKTDASGANTEASSQGHSFLVGKRAKQGQVILRTVPVVISGPAGEVRTSALLDEAYTVTLLDDTIAREIGASGPRSPLALTWTDNSSQTDSKSKSVDIKIRCEEEDFKLSNVRTLSNLDLPAQRADLPNMSKRWPHLANSSVAVSTGTKPRLLIGQDNCHLILPREVIEGPPDAPVLSRCKLGWSVHGKDRNTDTPAEACHLSMADDDLHQLVKDSFKTESFGVKVSNTRIQSRQDARAERILETTSRRVGDRWETGLLWRSPDITLPESKAMAMSRLLSLERKMARNPDFAEEYSKKLEQYVQDGYAERLSPEEAAEGTDRVWYLPHFGVTNPNKPGKLRLVFDAAARSNSMSLNDALVPGPDLLNSLPSVLFKFRHHRVAYAGDIRQMFHQVLIRKDDQPAQRFLWRGGDNTRAPDVYQMKAMTFGAVCSPASAQYVMRRNASDFSQLYPEAVKAIEENHYMDDYLDSSPNEEQAVNKARQVIDIHKAGGFEIRGWVSNSPKVLEGIPEELRSSSALTIEDTESPTEKTLGLKWQPLPDTFMFEVSQRLKDEEASTVSPTKRQVLRRVMSVFDPLGFLSFHTVAAKILLQDIWRTGTDWDEPLPKPLTKRWHMWWAELQDLGHLTVPRPYSISMAERSSLELHVFGDASELAFAAVAYFRIIHQDGSAQASMVLGKTRVAPLRPVSIPRLELQAALMASRVANTVQNGHHLPIDRTVLWTDSTTVLRWLRADARSFKPFVAHWLGEICELTDLSMWRWVPTAVNPADEATRQGQPIKGEKWRNGPEFLLRPESEWPVEKPPPQPVNDPTDDAEMKADFTAVIEMATPLQLPDTNNYSSWMRLVRVTGWMVRYVRNLRAKAAGKATTSGELRPGEFRRAQELWWLRAQADSYSDEVTELKKDGKVQKSSRLYQLSPMIDEAGVIRMSGRIRTAPAGAAVTLDPVILPPEHMFTRLLLQQIHVYCGHHGQSLMANEVRRKYWIPGLRSVVRRTWTICQRCKNDQAKPVVPQMGALPDGRTAAFVRPFTHCGMDYFGPMEVTVGRRHEKRYGVIFTCLTTRAVHLELAHDLTTDSAINAIRRFASRRGLPGIMYSDNGTNLRGAERELREALLELDQDKVIGLLTPRGVEWKFNPPAAPHMGGAWERLVRSVKVALQAVLTERAPKEETLVTLLAEVEAMLNNRPLTSVSCDPADEDSLTPSHFLLGTPSTAPAPGKSDSADLCSRKQWKVAQALADHFWRRWMTEYLPSLTRRTKWHQRNDKSVKVGDVVVVIDKDLPRGTWPRGRVTATYPGADGSVRVVDVKTQTGVFRRPTAKVCVLDVLSEGER